MLLKNNIWCQPSFQILTVGIKQRKSPGPLKCSVSKPYWRKVTNSCLKNHLGFPFPGKRASILKPISPTECKYKSWRMHRTAIWGLWILEKENRIRSSIGPVVILQLFPLWYYLAKNKDGPKLRSAHQVWTKFREQLFFWSRVQEKGSIRIKYSGDSLYLVVF